MFFLAGTEVKICLSNQKGDSRSPDLNVACPPREYSSSECVLARWILIVSYFSLGGMKPVKPWEYYERIFQLEIQKITATNTY